jgi:histone arginine demethylase JMJD6
MLVKGLAMNWPALLDEKWSVESLTQNYGDRLFTLNGNRGVIKLRDFLENKSATASIFDPSFEFDCPELLSDYSIPPLFSSDLLLAIPPEHRPDYRWFLVGPKYSGSSLHVDPLNTSAWNTLLVGEKQWVVVGPSIGNDNINEAPENDGNCDDAGNPLLRWFAETWPSHLARHTSQQSPGPRPAPVFTFTQTPGDTVFIPRGWQHAVLNVHEWNVAITHNFVIPSTADADAFISSYRAALAADEELFEDESMMTVEQLDEVERIFRVAMKR